METDNLYFYAYIMWIYLWNTALNDINLGGGGLSKVYLWDEQIRPSSRLPSAYQEVEYISNNGTAYIRTSFEVWTWHIYKAKIMYLTMGTWDSFWWYKWSGTSSDRLFAWKSSGDCWAIWAWSYSIDRGYWSASSNTEYEIEAQLYNWNQKLIVGGVTIFSYSATYSYSTWYSVCIFWNPEPNKSINIRANSRIYYFQLYDSSNNLELDLVPCYRKSDSVIWMYDLVNDQFYTNSWAGIFSKGNDVN